MRVKSSSVLYVFLLQGLPKSDSYFAVGLSESPEEFRSAIKMHTCCVTCLVYWYVWDVYGVHKLCMGFVIYAN